MNKKGLAILMRTKMRPISPAATNKLYQMEIASPESTPEANSAPNSFHAESQRQWQQRTSHYQTTRLHCHKMFVPGFGEASPEAKAAKHLHDFFTYVAVKIVTAQLQFTEQSYNPEAYEELMEFLGRHPLNDGDKFIASLLRESPSHKSLAMRILEVRSAYCKRDFEWDNLERLASKVVDDSNTRLMREYVLETSHVEEDE